MSINKPLMNSSELGNIVNKPLDSLANGSELKINDKYSIGNVKEVLALNKLEKNISPENQKIVDILKAKHSVIDEKQVWLAEFICEEELDKKITPDEIQILKRQKTDEAVKALRDYKYKRIGEIWKTIDNYKRKDKDENDYYVWRNLDSFKENVINTKLVLDADSISMDDDLKKHIFGTEKPIKSPVEQTIKAMSGPKRNRVRRFGAPVEKEPIKRDLEYFLAWELRSLDEAVSNEKSFAVILQNAKETDEQKAEHTKVFTEIFDKVKKLPQEQDMMKGISGIIADRVGGDPKTVGNVLKAMSPGNTSAVKELGINPMGFDDVESELDKADTAGAIGKKKFVEEYTKELKKYEGTENANKYALVMGIINKAQALPNWKFYDPANHSKGYYGSKVKTFNKIYDMTVRELTGNLEIKLQTIDKDSGKMYKYMNASKEEKKRLEAEDSDYKLIKDDPVLARSALMKKHIDIMKDVSNKINPHAVEIEAKQKLLGEITDPKEKKKIEDDIKKLTKKKEALDKVKDDPVKLKDHLEFELKEELRNSDYGMEGKTKWDPLGVGKVYKQVKGAIITDEKIDTEAETIIAKANEAIKKDKEEEEKAKKNKEEEEKKKKDEEKKKETEQKKADIIMKEDVKELLIEKEKKEKEMKKHETELKEKEIKAKEAELKLDSLLKRQKLITSKTNLTEEDKAKLKEIDDDISKVDIVTTEFEAKKRDLAVAKLEHDNANKKFEDEKNKKLMEIEEEDKKKKEQEALIEKQKKEEAEAIAKKEKELLAKGELKEKDYDNDNTSIEKRVNILLKTGSISELKAIRSEIEKAKAMKGYGRLKSGKLIKLRGAPMKKDDFDKKNEERIQLIDNRIKELEKLIEKDKKIKELTQELDNLPNIAKTEEEFNTKKESIIQKIKSL